MNNKSSKSYFKDEWLELVENRNAKGTEFRRREASFIAMATIGIFALTALLALNWSNYSVLLFNILVFNNLGMIGSVVFYFKTKNLRLSGLICIFFALALVLMLIYSGGKQDTALYWALYFPLAAFSVCGLRHGAIFYSIMVVATLVLLFAVDIVANYTYIEKTRFLMSVACIGILSFINEFFRTRESHEAQNITLGYKKDANTDPLTQLPNRRFLESKYVNSVIEQSENFAVIMADIDHFKSINDTYGHDVGDVALVHCAKTFSENVRKSDLLCRFGGEEFLVCLPNTNSEQASKIAEKLRLGLKESYLELADGSQLSFTCSFGVANLANRTFEDALKLADKRLYFAKENGRDQVISNDSYQQNTSSC